MACSQLIKVKLREYTKKIRVPTIEMEMVKDKEEKQKELVLWENIKIT
jgi:hypothetical protein